MGMVVVKNDAGLMAIDDGSAVTRVAVQVPRDAGSSNIDGCGNTLGVLGRHYFSCREGEGAHGGGRGSTGRGGECNRCGGRR